RYKLRSAKPNAPNPLPTRMERGEQGAAIVAQDRRPSPQHLVCTLCRRGWSGESKAQHPRDRPILAIPGAATQLSSLKTAGLHCNTLSAASADEDGAGRARRSTPGIG